MIVSVLLFLVRVLLFGIVLGPLPLPAPACFGVLALTSGVVWYERVQGGPPRRGLGAWRKYFSNIWIRLVLFGLASVVVDFFVVVAAMLGTIALQAAGLLRGVPLSYNFRNLRVRWLTTSLTATAFFLVVGLMTVLLAFVNGMYELAKGTAIPGNVIVLADGATDEVFSDLGYGDIGTLSNRDYVKKVVVHRGDKDVEEPMVSWELYQVVNQEIPNAREGERQRRFVQVRGIEDPVVSGAVHDLALKDGAWFDEGAGVQAVPGGGSEQYIQGVMGEGLAREMGHDFNKRTLQVGDTFQLGPRKWVVVGIMNSGGKTFDSEIWAKRKVVGEMLRKDTRSTAVVRVADGLDPAKTAELMTADFKSPAIQARTEYDYFDSLNDTNRVFLIGILFVTTVMAVGGVFGVMNTMFAAIVQRTRDIGVLRLLGYGRWQILVSFFLESLVLALIGGALGILLGSLCNGASATSQMSNGQGGGKSVMLKLVVDARIIGTGFVFTLLMGAIGGLLPALSAIRLKILDSLR